jgi:uncharacterized protein (TIGR02453 family)
MSYFTQDFLDFFKELSQNNYKEWFHENKKRYENFVKNPFYEFVQEMIDRIRIEDPELEITPKEAIFRINRDIRFAKDKSPYKTHMAASISAGGRKRHDVPGLYFQLSPEKSFVAGGSYVLEKETLYRIRSAIAKAPDAFSKVIEEEEFKKKFGTIQGEKNKVLPKEFQDVLSKQPLIANKQFYYWADLDAGAILKPTLPEIIMDYYHAGKGVNEFLKGALSG